jgi:hypothetical protein
MEANTDNSIDVTSFQRLRRIVFMVYFTTLSLSQHMQRKNGRTIRDELERIWKEAGVVLFRHNLRFCLMLLLIYSRERGNLIGF